MPGLALLLAAHVVAAVFWVGGMAFAYMILRPAAGPLGSRGARAPGGMGMARGG